MNPDSLAAIFPDLWENQSAAAEIELHPRNTLEKNLAEWTEDPSVKNNQIKNCRRQAATRINKPSERVLDLSDLTFDGPLPNLSSLSQVHTVFLCHNKIHQMSVEGLTALANGLVKLPNLRKLVINNNLLGRLSQTAMGALFSGLTKSETLEHLDLQNNLLGQLRPYSAFELGKGIARCAGLRVLDLANNPLGQPQSDSLRGIALGLSDAKCTGLQALYLNKNEIGKAPAEAAKLLFIAMEQWQDLKTLSMTANSLGLIEEKPRAALCNALSQYSQLKNLDLSNNTLTQTPVAFLPELISGQKNLAQLAHLNLQFNSLGQNPESVAAVLKGLKPLTTLQTIDLEHNNLGQHPEGTMAIKEFAQELHKYPKLKLVSLQYNNFGARRFAVEGLLKTALKQHPNSPEVTTIDSSRQSFHERRIIPNRGVKPPIEMKTPENSLSDLHTSNHSDKS